MSPVSKVTLPMAARASVIGLAVVVSACSTTDERRYAGAYQQVKPQPASDQGWKTEIEEDGKPAQVPPMIRSRPLQDDPTQPWSPNYGRADGAVPVAPRASPAPVAHPTWPRPIDTSMTSGPARIAASRRLNDDEAEEIMTRAISAHERRNP
jgi:hypothetical protein